PDPRNRRGASDHAANVFGGDGTNPRAAGMTELSLLSLNGEQRAWDDCVVREPASSFCHLAGWREILSDVLGAECLYWIAADGDGARQGVLPLVRARSRIFGQYLISLSFVKRGVPPGSVR